MFPMPGDQPHNSPYRRGSAPDFVWQNQRDDMERNARAGGGGGGGGGCLGILALIAILVPIALVAGVYALLGGLFLMFMVRMWNKEHRLGYGKAYKAAFWGSFWYHLFASMITLAAIMLLKNAPDEAPPLVQRVLFAQAELFVDPQVIFDAMYAQMPNPEENINVAELDYFRHDGTWLQALLLLFVPGLLIGTIAVRKVLRAYFPPPLAYGKALLVTCGALLPAIIISMRGLGWLYLQALVRYQDVLRDVLGH